MLLSCPDPEANIWWRAGSVTSVSKSLGTLFAVFPNRYSDVAKLCAFMVIYKIHFRKITKNTR
jgi:hypothetical protein